MIKSIFILFLSMLGTVLFFAFFMFIFANSVQMRCEHQQNKTFTCTIEKKLFGKMLTSSRVVAGVIGAHVAKSCDSDGCSYRTELDSIGGGSEPFDDVYSDNQPATKIANKINASIRQSDGPDFTVEEDLPWWLVIMLGVMSLVGLGIESALVFRTAYDWWMKRQM